jgi:hypothetical protein
MELEYHRSWQRKLKVHFKVWYRAKSTDCEMNLKMVEWRSSNIRPANQDTTFGRWSCTDVKIHDKNMVSQQQWILSTTKRNGIPRLHRPSMMSVVLTIGVLPCRAWCADFDIAWKAQIRNLSSSIDLTVNLRRRKQYLQISCRLKHCSDSFYGHPQCFRWNFPMQFSSLN